MTPLLLSFINKLPEEFNSKLELSGDKTRNKLREIEQRNLNIEKSKLMGLAVLLQNINISIFSNDELIEVSKLPLYYLDTLNIPHSKVRDIFSVDSSLYDTGSFRIYDLIDTESVTATSLQLGFASFNQYSVSSMKELITALYNRGF